MLLGLLWAGGEGWVVEGPNIGHQSKDIQQARSEVGGRGVKGSGICEGGPWAFIRGGIDYGAWSFLLPGATIDLGRLWGAHRL